MRHYLRHKGGRICQNCIPLSPFQMEQSSWKERNKGFILSLVFFLVCLKISNDKKLKNGKFFFMVLLLCIKITKLILKMI